MPRLFLLVKKPLCSLENQEKEKEEELDHDAVDVAIHKDKVLEKEGEEGQTPFAQEQMDDDKSDEEDDGKSSSHRDRDNPQKIDVVVLKNRL